MSTAAAETPTQPVRAAIYTRVSKDPTGLCLGVARQKQDCLALAEARGWQVVGEYRDNDLSAYSGKTRPSYERMLAAIRAGGVTAVVAWHPDRLHRSPRELESWIELLESHGVLVETVRAGQHDFTTAHGRLMARITGAVARSESDMKSERLRRAFEQRRGAGKTHGGPSYGWRRHYQPDGTVVEAIDEAEAAIVREAAERVVRGDSLRSIAQDFQHRGVPAPGGGSWVGSGSSGFRGNAVARLVRRERNVGLLVHIEGKGKGSRRVVVGDGAWPPILNHGLWEQACAVLADPARKTTTATASRHLLSGLGRCGVCGAVLRVATARSGSGRKFPVYRCSAKGCVSREQTFIDDFVTRIVIGRLSRPDATDLLVAEQGPEAAVAAEEAKNLRARLNLAADQYADGVIDAAQLARITGRLRPKIDQAEAAARVVDESAAFTGVVGAADVAAAWDALPLSRKRTIIGALMTITLDKKQRRGRGLDLEGVEVEWRS